MKVLYDISWLGLSYGKSSGATGLGRVIETLALRLADEPDCDLTYCAGDSFGALAGCLALLKEDKELGQTALAYPKFSASYRVRLHRMLGSLHQRERPNVGIRALRKLLRAVGERLPGGDESLERSSFERADIYHSPILQVPDEARRSGGPKCVLTVWDLIPKLFPQLAPEGAPAMLDAALKSLSADDFVICISEATKTDLCNYLPNLDPKRIAVTYLGASGSFRPSTDLDAHAHVRKKYHIPEGGYILCLSSLEPRKGMDHLIRSFGRFLAEQKVSDLYLVLAGPKGWKYQTIFDALESYSYLKERVILTGRVDEADLSELYSGALAFAFPSIYEGFGLPVLEAMQCGTPVITANTSSLPELVADAGLLIPPRDEEALGSAIWELYSRPELRSDLSIKGMARAKEFSWEKCTTETLAAYRTALDG